MFSAIVDRRYSSKLELVSANGLPGQKIGLERPKRCRGCPLSCFSFFAYDHSLSIVVALKTIPSSEPLLSQSLRDSSFDLLRAHALNSRSEMIRCLHRPGQPNFKD